MEFEECWGNVNLRLGIIPGKDALSAINQHLQDEYGVTISATAIVDAMQLSEIPADMEQLINNISQFALSEVE